MPPSIPERKPLDIYHSIFAASADEVTRRIEGMSDALTSFTEQDASLDLTAQAGESGGSALAEGLGTGAALGLKDLVDQSRFSGLRQEIVNSTTSARALRSALADAKEELRDLQEMKEIDALEFTSDDQEKLEDAKRRIQSLKQEADDLGIDLDVEGEDEVEEATDALFDFAGAGSTASGILARLGGPAAGAATLIAAVGTAAVTAATQLSQLTQRVGSYAQELQLAEAQSGATAAKIQQVATEARILGGERVDLDSIRDAFKELALRVTEAREGTGEAREGFRRLGISMQELEDKSTDEIFERVREEMRGLTRQQRILTAEQIMGGEAGQRLALVLGQSADAAAEMKEQIRRITLTDEQIDQLARIGREWDLLGARVDAVQRKLASDFAPVVETTVLPLLDTLLDLTSRLTASIDDLITSVPGLSGALGGLVVLANSLGDTEAPAFDQVEGEGSGRSGRPAEERGGFVGELKSVLTDLNRDIATTREKFERGLIPREEMERQIVSFRERAVDELLKLKQEFPALVNPELIDRMVRLLKQARSRTGGVELPSVDASPIQGAGVVGVVSNEVTAIEEQVEGMDLAGPTSEELEEMEDEVRRSMNDFEQIVEDAKQAVGDQLMRITELAADQLGRDIADGLFSLFTGPQSVVDIRLRKEQLRQQKQALRESLRQREISYKEFSLRVQAIQQRLADANKDLARQTESVFKKTFRSIADFVESIIKQVIQQITAAMAQALALKAIGAAFGIGPGAGSSIGTLFNISLTSFAEGGLVSSPTPALVGDNVTGGPEVIAPAADMKQYMKEAIAEMGGAAQQVHVTGELRASGRELRAVIREEVRRQQTVGRA